MNLRKAEVDDLEELVDMYIDLMRYAYPTRRLVKKIGFYEECIGWFKRGSRVTIVEKDNKVVGFSLVVKDTCGGLTETVLNAQVTYIKDEFRKSRAAYLLYNDVFNYAIEEGLAIMSMSTPESSPIVKKRFGAEHTFNHFEVTREYILKLQNKHK